MLLIQGFLHIDMIQVAEIFPHIRQRLTYSTFNIVDADAVAPWIAMFNRINYVPAQVKYMPYLSSLTSSLIRIWTAHLKIWKK